MTEVTDSISGKGLKFRGSFIYTVSPEGEAVESVAYGEGRFCAKDSTEFADVWFVRDYLGSVRMAVDITESEVQSLADAILSRSDYLPFGMPFRPARYSAESQDNGIPQSSLERWQFNGKPEQVAGLASTGLLDYGARMYDPFTARWNSVDPLAGKYPGTGPYAFCANDPVNLIDPDGMDIWSIDTWGFLVWEEDSEEDELYFKDKDGNLTDRHIKVNNSDILQALANKNASNFSSFTSTTGINDIFKVFKFAADNTKAEWVIHKNGETYTLGTKHDEDRVGGWKDYGLAKPDASVHSHPGIGTSEKEELYSMGLEQESGKVSIIYPSDWHSVRNDIKQNGRYTRLNYVYFPNSSHLYFVAYKKPQYIRDIMNYKHFYFGTLNNR